MLAKCVCQDVSAHIELRPHHLESNQLKDTLLTIDSDEEPIDPDDDITSELCLPTQLLKLGDKAGGLLRFGITTPFRFVTKPPKEMSRSPDIIQNPSASIFCLRVIPSFFLRDMYRALSLPASHCPPKTPNYSPMLHNAIMAIAAVYSDDPHINDWTSREYFATEAKRCLESECQKPDIGLIHALGLLGTYHADLGASILGDLYFGMSARVSQSLGLGLDASAWVKSGLITNEEMIARNYTHWTIFALDVCWALYVGREFPPLPEGRNTPMPLISPESDQLPWHYEPANIPPQPNFLSLIFSASTSLFLIARKIIHVLDDLGPRNSPQEDFIHHDQLVTQIDLELNSWKSQLSPEIDITLANRAKSTPQRLMLHCMYWWCFILLHRPFCNRRSRPIQTSDKEIDHVKVRNQVTPEARRLTTIIHSCASDLQKTLSSCSKPGQISTPSENTPMTLPQITFAAGTVFILLSLQATLNGRIAHQALKTSLSQAGLCVQYLYRMGKSWRGATRIGDILRGLLDAKVRPVLERRKILAEQAMDAGAISAPVATDDPQGDAKLHSLPFHPADAGTPSVMSSTSQAPCGEMPVVVPSDMGFIQRSISLRIGWAPGVLVFRAADGG
ncbi:hypothetical protein C8J57DRAFT_1491814 [Mycena rebaudengoi]|nr:hypothetical protein C8J57DRAFT_1491814 [Mycena rebaudengoi]